MMLIVATVTAALFASPTFTAAPAASAAAIPPIIVYIAAGAGVSAALVARICAEADAIWRPGGVTFSWRRVARAAAPDRRGGDGDQSAPGTLTLNIGDDPGVARGHGLPLGWIVFDAATSPQQEIYLSHANALTMLDDSRPVVGIVEQMPIAQREMLLARALGRALAHELGHYLLASKAHTPRRRGRPAARSGKALGGMYGGLFRRVPATEQPHFAEIKEREGIAAAIAALRERKR